MPDHQAAEAIALPDAPVLRDATDIAQYFTTTYTYTIPTTYNWQSAAASYTSAVDSYTSAYSSFLTSVRPNDHDLSTDTPAPTPTPTPPKKPDNVNHTGRNIGVGVGVVCLVVAVVAACIFFSLLRHSRRRRAAAPAATSPGSSTREMLQTSVPASTSNVSSYINGGRPYIREPSLLTGSPATMSSSLAIQPPQVPQLPQPPPLLSTTMDNSYFTGLDTADTASIAESHDLSTIASPTYASTLLEAPPPPYRPRSVASRQNSARYSAAPPDYGRLSRQEDRVQSPFDDPEEESPTDELPTEEQNSALPPSPTISADDGEESRDLEEMSDVSELSYQQEPTQSTASIQSSPTSDERTI